MLQSRRHYKCKSSVNILANIAFRTRIFIWKIRKFTSGKNASSKWKAQNGKWKMPNGKWQMLKSAQRKSAKQITKNQFESQMSIHSNTETKEKERERGSFSHGILMRGCLYICNIEIDIYVYIEKAFLIS